MGGWAGEVYIDADDFSDNPPPGYHRLIAGGMVRLRYAYVVTCHQVGPSPSGNSLGFRRKLLRCQLYGLMPEGCFPVPALGSYGNSLGYRRKAAVSLRYLWKSAFTSRLHSLLTLLLRSHTGGMLFSRSRQDGMLFSWRVAFSSLTAPPFSYLWEVLLLLSHTLTLPNRQLFWNGNACQNSVAMGAHVSESFGAHVSGSPQSIGRRQAW